VLDTPIAEGHHRHRHRHGGERVRPVAEIQFADYIYPGFDQIVSELARLRYRSSGDFSRPTIGRPARAASVAARPTRRAGGHFHPRQRVKVVMRRILRRQGLLITAIEDDDPWIFFERSACTTVRSTATREARVPWSAHRRARCRGDYKVRWVGRGGAQGHPDDHRDVWNHGVRRQAAAAALGVDAEIVIARARALDVETIVTSVRKTGRCVVAHEATRFSGLAPSSSRSSRRSASGTWRHRFSASRLGYALSSCFRMGVLSRHNESRRPQGLDGVA